MTLFYIDTHTTSWVSVKIAIMTEWLGTERESLIYCELTIFDVF